MTIKKKTGRKFLAKDGKRLKARSVKTSDAQWEKCLTLGGGAWVRKQIDKAKLPKVAE